MEEKKSEKLKRKIDLMAVFYVVIIFCLFFVVVFISINHDYNVLNKEKQRLETEIVNITAVTGKTIEDKQKEIDFLKGEVFIYQKKFPQFTKILSIVKSASKKYNLEFLLILAVISIESNFDQYAISNKEAYGLMQVHYPTWKNEFKIDAPEKLFNIEFNIDCGCKILKKYLDETGGNVFEALYLYGNGYFYNDEGVYAKKVLENKFLK